ncbi:MAG: toll/interleukin-1 receptor domain-containing protein [Chloroflexota bacterium]
MTDTFFISYSRQDLDYVKKLEQQLHSEGFTFWRDEHEIGGGDVWWELIKKNLENCAALIVIMSPDSAKSSWVMRETAIADYLGKTMVPLLLDGDITDPVWSICSKFHITDVTDGRLPSSNFYNHLERFAKRQKIMGGVRVDGIYLCDNSNPLFQEALRFYADETVTNFIMSNDEAISRTLGNDGDQIIYDVDDESVITFAFKSGRNMTARFKDSKLSVRIEYPNGQKDSRWYKFVPFED